VRLTAKNLAQFDPVQVQQTGQLPFAHESSPVRLICQQI
jgi:hypothetical protein